ncbi:MAG: class I SAM-dependent methyltransferase [Limisphaerales bacterium]
MQPKTQPFYDGAYYKLHFGRLLADDAYFALKGRFWKKAIGALWPVNDGCWMLDYGCGLGQITAAFEGCEYYDVAEFSRTFVGRKGKRVYGSVAEIPEARFDLVLSSHSLEHALSPAEELKRFARWAKDRGVLILILPIERDAGRHLEVDANNHLFAWTFQTIANLLHATGWQPCRQDFIYDSFCLRPLGRLLGARAAVDWAWRLGKWRQAYRSMFVVARKRGGEANGSGGSADERLPQAPLRAAASRPRP